jgi:hypothetical protein
LTDVSQINLFWIDTYNYNQKRVSRPPDEGKGAHSIENHFFLRVDSIVGKGFR